jgi:uncharacterized protein
VKKLFALSLSALALGAAAQQVPADVAVPFYTPPAFMKGVHQHWFSPRGKEFAAEAGGLPGAVDKVCAGAPDALRDARAKWQSTAAALDRLTAVAIGPLLTRRTIRQIDFAPTRPELIERAIAAQPADLKAMERVGTPAKGLPGLEWLLWTKPVAANSPGCRYAVLVASEIDVEAQALNKAFAELAAKDWEAEEEAAVTGMGEILNQWVGGIERLRWANLEKPVRSAGGKPPAFPRAASGSTRQSWQSHWQGLRTLGAALDNKVPQPGEGLVSLETYLRGRGLNPLANKLAGAVAQGTKQVEALAPADNARTLAAARSLASLKRLAEAEVAPALEVNIGFSDADGD